MTQNAGIIYTKASWHFIPSHTGGLPSLVCFKTFHKYTDNSGLWVLIWKERQSLEKKSGQMTQVQILAYWTFKAFRTHSGPNWNFSTSGMSQNEWGLVEKNNNSTILWCPLKLQSQACSWSEWSTQQNEWRNEHKTGNFLSIVGIPHERLFLNIHYQLHGMCGSFPSPFSLAHHPSGQENFGEIATGARTQECLQEVGWRSQGSSE